MFKSAFQRGGSNELRDVTSVDPIQCWISRQLIEGLLCFLLIHNDVSPMYIYRYILQSNDKLYRELTMLINK